MKEAEWDAEYINNLSDSAFAYIEPGGEKDEQGKTTPRSLRHFPYKNAQENLSPDHVRNGLARLGQDLGDWATPEAKAQIKKRLCAAAKELEIESEVCGLEKTLAEQQGNQEPGRDEHGCVVGKERWDAETGKCVPIEAFEEQQGEEESDAHKQFMAQCLESGKTMEQCAAEWKQKQEGGETQAESIVALRRKLVKVEAALTKMEKQQKRQASSWKEKYERLYEAMKGAIPAPPIWRSWTAVPQRYVQENLRILRESESKS